MEERVELTGQRASGGNGDTGAAGALPLAAAAPGIDTMRGWNFLTSHARVLLAVAVDPQATVSEIAETAMLSRRTVFRILDELQEAGYVRRMRSGRRNTYEVDPKRPIAEPLLEGEPVSSLVEGLAARAASRATSRRGPQDGISPQRHVSHFENGVAADTVF